MSDKIRQNLQNNDIDLDVITISKFRDNELTFFLGDGIEIQSKAELLLFFATMWKRFFPDNEYEHFIRAFNLLTDLRSFSLDGELYESVLVEYDEILKKAVIIFNELLKQMNYFDEHKAYNELANSIREVSLDDYHEKKRNIIFQGFQFFTSQQLDFLKALALRDDVFICLPEMVYENRKKQDWIHWLEDNNTQTRELPKKESSHKILYYEFSKSGLNRFLIEQDLLENDFIIPSKKIGINTINEFPVFGHNFKSAVDLFSEEIYKLRKKIEKDIFYIDKISCHEFSDYIKKEIKQTMISSKDEFLKLKVWSELYTLINKWNELAETNDNLEMRDFRVLLEVLKLNLPRNSVKPLGKELDHSIYDLTNYHQSSQKKVMCITGENSSLRPNVSLYPEKVEDYLISIGPLKRSELEYLFIRHSIEEILQEPNCILLVEKGITEHSEDWSKIIAGLKILKLPNKEQSHQIQKISFDLNKNKSANLQKVSASRLQTFVDCPQKYYYRYIDKISPDYQFQTKLMPNQLGELEHKIVEEYFKIPNTDFSQVVQRVYASYLGVNQITLSKDDWKNYLVELTNYSKNGIAFVQSLDKVAPAKKYFEKKVEGKLLETTRTGSIDFCFENSTLFGLVDFKRSAGSIPSKGNILNFNKVQLWFYLKSLESIFREKENYFVGYFNMSSPEDSLFFTNSVIHQDFLKSYEDLGIKFYEFEGLEKTLADYTIFEEELINLINSESKFSPIPRDNMVCSFCDVKMICSRGLE